MAETRREFLKAALAAGAATRLSGGAPTAEDGRRSGEVPRRILGRTKERVTLLGLGCAYAGSGLSEKQTRATLEAALEGGVRYFDAAPEYDRAEVRLGPAVRSVRDEVFLVTKTYALDAGTAERDLETALKQLGTDHVDLFLQHGVGLKPQSANRRILAKGGSLEYLLQARKKGLTRFIGMSVHAPHETAMELLGASGAWDVVMPFINYVTPAQEKAGGRSSKEGRGPCTYERLLARVHKDDLGLVAMKVLGGHPGKLADDFDRAFRYALSVPGVACAVIGVRSPEQVHRAVNAAKTFRPLTEFEMEDAIETGDELVRTGSVKVSILEGHRLRDSGSGLHA